MKADILHLTGLHITEGIFEDMKHMVFGMKIFDIFIYKGTYT